MAKSKQPRKRATKKAEKVEPPQPWVRVTDELLASISRGEQHHAFMPNPLPPVPPGVGPKGGVKLAMDAGTVGVNQWAAQQVVAGAFFEGTVFLGFTYLSQLAQRAEYRRPSETLATEMTRKWIELKSRSGDKGKAQKLAELNSELERLETRRHFRKCAEYDGFMGRMHLYLDTGDTTRAEELLHDIGSGKCSTSVAKFKGQKGFLKALRPVEPVWCYPASYDSVDPLESDWYNPRTWFVMSKELHRSRLLLFVGREVPDLLKPSYAFGGLSLSQMAKPTIDNWLRTRQSVADMLWSYSITVMKMNLTNTLNVGAGELIKRLRLFASGRTNQGVALVDKETEDLTNLSAPLSGLDHLQAQAQEHMCSVLGEPVVKLLGIQPSGLNATAEGELRTWYDHVAAHQEKLFRPNLTTVINFAQMSLWGHVDDDITFEFVPLMELSEMEEATLRKTEADTAVAYIQSGVLDPIEERERLASDPNSLYDEIDPEDAPVPPGQEGMMPGGEAPIEGEPGLEQDDAPPGGGLNTLLGQLGITPPTEPRLPDQSGRRAAPRSEPVSRRDDGDGTGRRSGDRRASRIRQREPV